VPAGESYISGDFRETIAAGLLSPSLCLMGRVIVFEASMFKLEYMNKSIDQGSVLFLFVCRKEDGERKKQSPISSVSMSIERLVLFLSVSHSFFDSSFLLSVFLVARS
jgi:hypothetical protein